MVREQKHEADFLRRLFDAAVRGDLFRHVMSRRKLEVRRPTFPESVVSIRVQPNEQYKVLQYGPLCHIYFQYNHT